MMDVNKLIKQIEAGLASMDEKVNAKLATLYEKLDEYRDVFKKNTSENKKYATATVVDDKKKSEDKFVEMAPFLDEESLHELVVEFCNGNLETDMSAILPFLDEKDVGLLAEKFEDGVKEFKGLCLDELLPFADDESIDRLFLAKFMNGETDEHLFPFVSDDCWHELVVKYCESEDSNLNIDDIYPYLNEKDLKLLFKTYLKRRKPNS